MAEYAPEKEKGPQKLMAKCLGMLRTTHGEHWVIRKPFITLVTSDVVSTLRISLSWDRPCVEHCRRERGSEVQGQKQHL